MTAVAANASQPLWSDEQADYWENWFTAYNRVVSRLQAAKQAAVWEQWFDAYSQRLANVLAKRYSHLTEVQP
jgi:hypothetical protein